MTNTDRIPILENRMEQLNEDVDPGDVYSILCIIADANGYFMPDFLDSRLARDIVEYTQSNPKRSLNRLRRISILDDAIARYDDE